MAEATRTPRHELVAAVLLGLAAVGSAWNAAQAARWGGQEAEAALRSHTLRAEATEASLEAAEELEVDVSAFLEWVDAKASGREELAAFVEARFNPALREAFGAWRRDPAGTNGDGPLPRGTPFDRAEYRPAARGRVADLHAQAAAMTERAHVTNTASTNSVAAIVPFAVVLCLAGVATKLDDPGPRDMLLWLAGLMLLGGVVATIMVPLVSGV